MTKPLSGEAIRAGEAEPFDLEVIKGRHYESVSKMRYDFEDLIREVERLRASSDAPKVIYKRAKPRPPTLEERDDLAASDAPERDTHQAPFLIVEKLEPPKARYGVPTSEPFELWWERDGQFVDPDTDDVPWFDKRKALAELAFVAAMVQSGNYTANSAVDPTEVTFTNGRRVRLASPRASAAPTKDQKFTCGYCEKCQQWKDQPIGQGCHICETSLIQFDGAAPLSSPSPAHSKKDNK